MLNYGQWRTGEFFNGRSLCENAPSPAKKDGEDRMARIGGRLGSTNPSMKELTKPQEPGNGQKRDGEKN